MSLLGNSVDLIASISSGVGQGFLSSNKNTNNSVSSGESLHGNERSWIKISVHFALVGQS